MPSNILPGVEDVLAGDLRSDLQSSLGDEAGEGAANNTMNNQFVQRTVIPAVAINVIDGKRILLCPFLSAKFAASIVIFPVSHLIPPIVKDRYKS